MIKKLESKNSIKGGTIIDYISGIEVKATPEEIDAVQVFSKQLVEDYGYSKSQIQTRPQFRVKARPSDTTKTYPVDIAIFNNSKKNDDELFIVVECKKKSRKDGRTQLEDYMRLSKAELGVWFNGEQRLFLRKIEKKGKVIFDEIPNIPKKGQRIEDIGKFKKGELKPEPTHNLKSVFKAIRNHLAGNTVGTTRDEELAGQIINIIFCKLYDEKNTKLTEDIRFRAGIDESAEEIKKRIVSIFDDVKKDSRGVIEEKDNIELDAKSIEYIVGELQNYSLMKTERDVISDAFEVFIGHALKGGQGQFFTPRNVINMMVEILDPKDNELIIDSACGSGGFLIETLRHVWKKLEEKGKERGWSKSVIEKEQRNYATEYIRGIEKDYFLSKVAKAYMTLIGDGTSGIFCEDSLENSKNWKKKTQLNIELESFSVLLTNPPFGSKIPIKGEEKIKQYELGYKWKKNKEGMWEKGKIKDKESPQILFIERNLQLLKEGGRMAIVLPDGVYGNESLEYVRNWLLKQGRIIAIIDVPLETFMPHTSTKTTILIFQKISPIKIKEDYEVFMAVAENCGHDRRGKETGQDDILDIATNFKKWAKENKFRFN